MGSEEELVRAGEGETIIRTHCIKILFLIKEKSNCKNKGLSIYHVSIKEFLRTKYLLRNYIMFINSKDHLENSNPPIALVLLKEV